MKRALFTILASLLVSTFAFQADAASLSGKGNRKAKKWGVVLSAFGSPTPSLVGVNLHYTIKGWLNLHGGLGFPLASGASITTLGVGARLYVPSWSLSPAVGLDFSYLSSTASTYVVKIKNSLLDLADGFITNASGTVLTAPVGLSWQFKNGLHLMTGYTIIFSGGTGGTPFFELGLFF